MIGSICEVYRHCRLESAKGCGTQVIVLLVLLQCALLSCSCERKTPKRETGLEVSQNLQTAIDVNDVRGALAAGQLKRLPARFYMDLEHKAASPKREDQMFAVTVLGRLPNRNQFRILQQVARESQDLEVRCQAMYSLGLLRDPAAVPFLLDVLAHGDHDPDQFERLTAAAGLGLIRDGYIDDMPLEVTGFVVVPTNPGAGSLLRWPTLEEQVADYTAWWEANATNLLQATGPVRDYREGD